ncbi:MAG: SpoIIE family protein phosphatase [Gemmataceae bacterium]
MPPPRSSLLLVDDDANSRALLRHYLQPHGFDVTEAARGAEALARLEERTFDLVLLDVDMPDMDGFEVLRAIRDRHDPADLPVMMATVMNRSSDVVEALGRGANDYVTKPFDLPVVLARARAQQALKQAIDRARELELNLSLRNVELERSNRRIREELAAAARVQEALLPAGVPRLPGAEFAWRYRPCAELAGDLLGLVALPGGRVCLYVLDVVNHGVKAALLAVMINRVLSRLLGDEPLPPREIAAQLHREFPWDDRTELFFTLMLGVLDPAAGTFRYVAAGHPGPLLLPRAGEPRCLRTPGSPIGLGSGEYDEHQLGLKSGDRLYLFSDGLPEAMNYRGQAFGEARCVELLSGSRGLPLGESVTRLVSAIERWTEPDSPHDDISVTAVELV